MDDSTKHLAGRQAEWVASESGERIPPLGVVWDSLQTELALHARTRQDRDECKLRLEQMTASYEVLKAQYEDAMSMALEPEEGLTVVERKVLAAEPAVTDWRTV